MNFIAHYFLDRHVPESYFAIGAATPDLLSIYNPVLRIKKHHLSPPGDASAPAHHAFYSGVSRHFVADAGFHSSAFFLEETQFVSLSLTEEMQGLPIPRKFFLAHILVELILDRVIMKDHPNILTDYYHHFDATPMREVKETTEAVAGHVLPNYEHFLRKFKENRYLIHYHEWDHLLFVVGRILRRVGIMDHAFADSVLFQDFLIRYENRLMARYPLLFNELAGL